MKLRLKVVLGGLLLASSAFAVQKVVKRSTFVDTNYGFSLEAPRFPDAGPTTAGIALVFSGPPKDGFAPNVNVSVQATATTAKAYRELSFAQLDQLKLKRNSDRNLKVSGRDAIEVDYEGTIGGSKPLRFLALAVIDKDRVIQITCTALPEAFPAVEAEFRACLQSFKLD